jgi:hypothetical protein
MYTIEVTEANEAFWPSPQSNVGVIVTIKMLSTIKLHYPDGIEFDLPRTYRSVYQYRFDISRHARVFPEHWGWLIDAIQKNYSYELNFSHNENQRFIRYADGAITFELAHISSYRDGYEQARFYLPLEYCRDDFITACRSIQDIYHKHHDTLQFDRRTAKMLTSLAISPLELPHFQVTVTDVDWTIVYYSNHDTRSRTFHVPGGQLSAFRAWLQFYQAKPGESGSVFDGTDGSQIKVYSGRAFISIHDSQHRHMINIPSDHVPRLLAALPM